MKNKRYIYILVGFLMLCNACLYSDNEIFYVEPIPDLPPVIDVRTNLDTIATPVVEDSLLVEYDISIQNGKLYFVEAWLPGRSIYESDTSHGSFWLYPHDVLTPGIDTLHLDIYYSSNTNSLADVTGYEALEVNLKYGILFKW